METILGLITSVVWVLVAAVVVRRLLGVPVGWPRTIVVGLVILAGGFPLMGSVYQATGLFRGNELVGDPWVVVVVAFIALAWLLTLGVGALVVLELVAPTGSLPSPLGLVRGWPSRWRRSRRIARIMAIATREGLSGIGAATEGGERRRLAVALRRTFDDAGVTFIKLGQMMASRPDLVSPEIVAELATLQTHATPVPWSAMEPVLTEALGCPISEVFAAVDPEPLAAASVAQVHRGVLADGRDVVVKVQRPGARPEVEADLEVIAHLSDWLERRSPWARDMRLRSLADGFAASLREELDYRIEVDNMADVTAATGVETVRIPAVYRDLSSETVIVMEHVEGVTLTDAADELATLAAPEQRRLAGELLDSVVDQVLVAGVFHADLHAGNVLLGGDGQLVLLDFGAVGRLDETTRMAFGLLLHAFDRGDGVGATDALLEITDRPDDLDERGLERAVGALIAASRLRSGRRSVFPGLFEIAHRYRLRVPLSAAAAFRAFGTLEGTLGLLDPDFDLVEEARSYSGAVFEQLARPETVRRTLEEQLATMLPALQRLPRRITRIAEDLETGRFSVRVRMFAEPDDRRFVTDLVQQVVVTVLAAAITVGAVVLLVSDGGARLTESLRLYDVLGALFLLFGFVLGLRALIRVFAAGERPRR